MVDQSKRSSPEQLSPPSNASALDVDLPVKTGKDVASQDQQQQKKPETEKEAKESLLLRNGHHAEGGGDEPESWPFETPQLYRIAFTFFKGVTLFCFCLFFSSNLDLILSF